MVIRALGRTAPHLSATAFVHPSAEVIGDVRLGGGTSVWPGAVLRGDIERIVVGDGSNIQDNVVVHTDHGVPTWVGRNVTVGHGAILHSCRVGDGALIGMGAILLGRSVVGKGALVGAKSLVSPGTRVPAGHLALGRPARTVRPLTAKEKSHLRKNARQYQVYARRHKQALKG
ncbi:MAG: gamma carbonic anhydrase family protein [Elusimicrobia bacterium]|nr:gamma carbonic anhydrase family protein [Elusimicrobiota bacterium]